MVEEVEQVMSRPLFCAALKVRLSPPIVSVVVITSPIWQTRRRPECWPLMAGTCN
jgi:hypothetical protein